MTIKELLNLLGSQSRRISNWITHPFDNVGRIARTLRDNLQETKLFENNRNDSEKPNRNNSNQTEKNKYLVTSASDIKSKIINDSGYIDNHNGHTANGVNGHSRKLSDLSVGNGNSIVITQNKQEIPLLTPNQDIQSFKGRYRIGELIKPIKDNTIIREYEGYTFPHNQLVLVKEYLLLEKYFGDNEAEKRQRELVKRANIKLKSSQTKNGISGQDFRLITPLDAFGEDRSCYIISEFNQSYISLKDYLNENIEMDYEEVRTLLKRVLQSLYF